MMSVKDYMKEGLSEEEALDRYTTELDRIHDMRRDSQWKSK